MNYRGYLIKWSKAVPTCLTISHENGGKTPEVLDQLFTNTTFAKRFIDTYLDSKKKGKQDGETVAESRV